MRDSLTFLAILLICLLTAALVVPYFVDLNAHRALIEAKLSQAAGTRIAIAGPIKVRLLPQPKVEVGQVTIGDVAPGRQSFTAAGLDVDIALTALMRGELQVGEAVLRAPRLELAADPDGAFRLKFPGFGQARRIELDHVAVTDGAVTLVRAGQPALTLSGLDFEGEAASLAGPFKATGRFGSGSGPHGFRLSTSTIEAGQLRLKLSLDPSGSLPAIEFEGIAAAGGGTPRNPVGPSLAGLATLRGDTPIDGTPATIPWVLSGRVKAGDDKVILSDLDVHAGADLLGLGATGTGEIALGPEPRLSLRLRGPQIDLDRLAAAPEKSSLVPPKGVDLVARLGRRLGIASTDGPRMPIALDYGFDTITAGRFTLLGVNGQAVIAPGKPLSLRFAGTGPEASHVTLEGTFEGGAAPVFRGSLDAGTRDLPRLADDLAPLVPELSAWARATVPARTIDLVGNVDLSAVGVAARDAVLRLDRTEIAGTMTYTGAVGSDRARLFADVTSDALDLDDLPDLGSAGSGWGDKDLDVALTARAVKVAPAGVGALDAGRIGLRLHKTGEKAVLDSFSADLGNARLTATGSLDDQAASIEAHVDAPQLDAIASLLARLLPGSPTAWILARASSLSPARIDLGLKAARGSDGALLPTSLTLDGMMNASRVKASLDPDTPGDFDPATALFTLNVAADAPEGGTLLRQFGLPVVAANGPPLGAGRLKGRAHGSAVEGFVGSLDASAGGAVVTFQGRAKSDHGNGHVSVRGSDLAPVLRATGAVFAATDAAWPAEADTDLAWHDGTLAFRRLRGRAGSIAFSGDLDAMLSAASGPPVDKPTLFGTLTLDRLTLPAVLDVVLGPAPRDDISQADPKAPRAAAEPWSHRPFGAPLLQWPRSEVAVKVKSVAFREGIEAHDASFTLRVARGALTLADFTGTVGAGKLGGSLTLRRDGDAASVSGTASWSGIDVDWPALAGRSGGTCDFGGSGNSPAALVAALAGTGSVTLADARIARLDPAALARAARNAERNGSGVDADEISDSVVPDLDHAPLRLGDISAQASLAVGVFRVGPIHATSEAWTADATLALDLKDLGFSSKTVLRVDQPLPDWKGEAPQVTLTLSGPIEAPHREVDVAAFVNTLQARAIARDQERIDILQQDIRERAFFNRRLKAIEAEQAQEREKAEAANEIQRQMRQNGEGARDIVPGPPSRPSGLPGSKPSGSGAALRVPRSPGSKPAPGAATIPPPSREVLDPSTAGRY